MDKIAIYDMDRTVTRIGTFTPFLVFVAKRHPLRMLLLPLYLLALIGYPLGLLGRKRLKEIGFGLILGRRVAAAKLQGLARDYAGHVLQRNFYGEARQRIAADRAEGCRLVMATASPDFYVDEIAALLGFDAVMATAPSATGSTARTATPRKNSNGSGPGWAQRRERVKSGSIRTIIPMRRCWNGPTARLPPTPTPDCRPWPRRGNGKW
jgi:phosphoserine phosphatase